MLTRTLLLGLTLVTLSLAGCSDDTPLRGEEVLLTSGQVPIDSATSRTLTCGNQAHLDVHLEGVRNGSLTVSVRDGAGVPLYDHEFLAGDESAAEDLVGSVGKWTVTVHRTLELDADFTVALAC